MNVGFEVHESHLPLWERTDWRYAFLMGGRGNGRSGSASRYAISSLLSTEYTRGAFMRAVREDIRASCWRELNDRVDEQEIREQFRITENDMLLEYGKNSIRAFGFRASSGSLTARLKSLANFNFAWIEEMEEIGEAEFRTFDDSLRTTQGRTRIVGTLNPPPKDHWIIRTFFDLEPHPEAHGFYIPRLKPEYEGEVLYIPGTWRENEPNLDPKTIERYQRYRETNPAYYWHAIEGLVPETVQGRIYSDWREVPDVPHEARLIGYGLDFGYDPDPDALVAVYYHDGGYILDERLYLTENSPENLIAVCQSVPKAPIVCDTNEKRMIAALRGHGLSLLETEKGKDSVDYGIRHVQSLRISYTSRSINLKREYENYVWKFNKENESMQVPNPSCADHLLDAARYCLSMLVKYKEPQPLRQDRIHAQGASEIHKLIAARKRGYNVNRGI